MNPKIKSAFALSIASLSGMSTYLTIVLLERFSIFYINAHPLLNALIYFATVIAPVIFAIVSLVTLNKLKDLEGIEASFKKIAFIFSWIALGSFLFYITLALTLILLFGLSLFVI